MARKKELPKEVQDLQNMADALGKLSEAQFALIKGVLIGMGAVKFER